MARHARHDGGGDGRHRYRDRRGVDDDWREVQYAYGRYSATDQGDQRRSQDRRRYGSHGTYDAGREPGYERDRADYYDPDRAYRQYREPRRYEDDDGRRGDYRGVGPKGYTRSDERIREEVCEYLTDDPHIDASHIEVGVKDGEVLLGGSVSSRADKRHAEDLAEHAMGVKDVQNNLRIVRGEGGPGGEASSPSASNGARSTPSSLGNDLSQLT